MKNTEVANEAAISFRWLAQNLTLGGPAVSRCGRSWEEVRSSMRMTTQQFVSMQDWISDFWICKTAENGTFGSGIAPKWEPPEEFGEWATLPAQLVKAYTPERARPTNHARFGRLLRS